MAHSTATPEAPAINIQKYESCTWRNTFVHYAVDWDETIQIADTRYIASYRLLNGNGNQLNQVKEKLISYKINSFGFTGLIHSKDFDPSSDIKATTPSLEEIMIYFSKKEDMYV